MDAATIIAQDFAPGAVTLRAWAMLLAAGSPYVCPDAGREPVSTDSLFASRVLAGGAADAFAPGYVEALGREADALPDAEILRLDQAVRAALEPVFSAVAGMGGPDIDAPPSNGLVPALLLRCAREFGWTIPETLDSPLATLLLTMREARIQAGRAITYAQMELMDAMKARLDAGRNAEKPAHVG